MARKLVLVVEDDPALQRLLLAVFARGPYRVLEASGVPAALELARRERPAVVVLDVGIPEADWLELGRQLKAEPDPRGTALVLLTDGTEDRARVLAAAAGADAHLTKPFSPRRLLEVVDGLVI